jgi:hypothetical protein
VLNEANMAAPDKLVAAIIGREGLMTFHDSLLDWVRNMMSCG